MDTEIERLSAALGALKSSIYGLNSAVAHLEHGGIGPDHLRAIGILLEQQYCLLAEKMDRLERAIQSTQSEEAEESELPF